LRRIASRGAEFSERHGRAPASAGGNRTRPRLRERPQSPSAVLPAAGRPIDTVPAAGGCRGLCARRNDRA